MANQSDVGEGAVLDQIARVLAGRTRGEQRRIITALADKFNVELSGGGGEGLGSDDFGNKHRKGDTRLGYTSSLGTAVDVNLSAMEREHGLGSLGSGDD